MVSLAVPTYNRSEMTMDSFSQILNSNLIDEVIIQDDYSKSNIYFELWNLVHALNNKKVHLNRNEKNLGPFHNKYEAVKNCKNDWVILLDSDNVIDHSYVRVIDKLVKEPDILYCAETLYSKGKETINWSYEAFNQLVIDKKNVKKYIDNGLFETWMNTGNHFFNRDSYLKVVECSECHSRLKVADSIYFSYLWLLFGNRMKVVPGLAYIHNIHDGSYYIEHRTALRVIHKRIKRRFRIL